MATSNQSATAESGRLNGKPDAANETSTRRTPPSKRPNYKHIHRFPLPLNVHPLPPLIPHNPLSVISIALSYLTYFIYPPHHEVFSAYFDSSSSSVQVTDPRAIRALWEMGFFGKGSLSRSEPTWLEREKKRRGLLGVDTSEELTRQRRLERREMKLERARKEKEAIAEQLKAESQSVKTSGADIPDDVHSTEKGTSNGGIDHGTKSTVDENITPEQVLESTSSAQIQGGMNDDDTGREEIGAEKSIRFSQTVDSYDPSARTHSEAAPSEEFIKNEEHLQLSHEDTLFLVYGLGALQIFDYQDNSLIPASSLLPLFCRHSYFPPRDPCIPLEPDDPFLLSYVAYHHFRSLGWVVRSGIKFGIDYVLYNRGPVFSHAEFAVMLLPSYGDPYWTATEERRKRITKKQNHTWWWLHAVNRVQAQVKKSLILCYVEVPPPSSSGEGDYGGDCSEKDIGAVLKRYKVRELSVKRWVPNRSRD